MLSINLDVCDIVLKDSWDVDLYGRLCQQLSNISHILISGFDIAEGNRQGSDAV